MKLTSFYLPGVIFFLEDEIVKHKNKELKEIGAVYSKSEFQRRALEFFFSREGDINSMMFELPSNVKEQIYLSPDKEKQIKEYVQLNPIRGLKSALFRQAIIDYCYLEGMIIIGRVDLDNKEELSSISGIITGIKYIRENRLSTVTVG